MNRYSKMYSILCDCYWNAMTYYNTWLNCSCTVRWGDQVTTLKSTSIVLKIDWPNWRWSESWPEFICCCRLVRWVWVSSKSRHAKCWSTNYLLSNCENLVCHLQVCQFHAADFSLHLVCHFQVCQFQVCHFPRPHLIDAVSHL